MVEKHMEISRKTAENNKNGNISKLAYGNPRWRHKQKWSQSKIKGGYLWRHRERTSIRGVAVKATPGKSSSGRKIEKYKVAKNN